MNASRQPAYVPAWLKNTLQVMALVAFALLAHPVAASAGEAIPSAEVQEYLQDYDVSEGVAEGRLETQQDAMGLNETLSHRLGGDFAGLWFDNKRGEFVIPLVSGAHGGVVSEIAQGYDLQGEYRVEPADSDWSALERAQKHVTRVLSEQVRSDLFLTSIDPQANAVKIVETEAATPVEEQVIARAAQDADVEVKVERLERERFQVHTRSCVTSQPRECSKPLRGGVGLGVLSNGINSQGLCTAGFKATGNTFGNRFVLTAGHCAALNPNAEWTANAPAGAFSTVIPIGKVEEYTFGLEGDAAKIKANGSGWDTPSWPTLVAHFWEDQEYPIYYEANSYVGEYVCFSGNKSGTSCGIVQATHVEGLHDSLTDTYLSPMTEVFGICTEGGDSGGPFYSFSTHTALGMLSLGEGSGCLQSAYYQNITEATDRLGVSVGARIGAPPEVRTEPATDIQARSAVLHGSINPNGLDTSYDFTITPTTQYGYGMEGNVGAGWQRVGVSNPIISELRPYTTYHVHLLARNSSNQGWDVDGGEQQFTTAAIPPTAKTESVTDITARQATVSGSVNSEEVHTTARIEYGATLAYGMSAPTPPKDMGSDRTEQYLQQTLVGLNPSTTYHYRIAATNDAGQTTYGSDQTFTTPSLAPLVVTKAPTNSDETSVVIRGSVNPQGAATTYQFEYGLSSAYGSTAPAPQGNAGSGSAAIDVTQLVSGLVAGQTYHYRLVATNAYGTRVGSDQILTTGWASQNLPTPSDGNQASMAGISCVTPASCMAVGKYRVAASGITLALAEKWDGSKWTSIVVPNPAPSIAISFLSSVSCPTSTFCEAVGYYLTNAGAGGGYAARWDGQQWTTQSIESPGPQTSTWLFGVSCLSATFCETGGYKTDSTGYKAMVQRWDGSKWIQVAVPSIEGAKASYLMSISCSSTAKCVGVGAYEDTAGQQHPAALHWNGSAWTAQTPPTPAGFKTGRLFAVSCGSATSCQATGSYFNEAGLRVAFADQLVGSTWQALPTPYPSNARESWLLGASCESASSCLATGVYETDANQTISLAARWTGSKWEPQSPPSNVGNVVEDLESVSCVSAVCTAAGYTKATTFGATTAFAATYHMPVPMPVAVTDAASSVQDSGATLNSTIIASGLPTTYKFEYGPTNAYGTSAPASPASAGSGQEAVQKSFAISGLSPLTTYHYRVVATNSEGTSYGEDRVFTTLKPGTGVLLKAMALTDPFNGGAAPASNFAVDWTALPWAAESPTKGENTATGWRSVAGFPTINGAYYGPSISDMGLGVAVQATMAISPPFKDRYFCLWLDMPSPMPNKGVGYQLKFARASETESIYTVTLSRWQNGTQSVLASKAGYSFSNGNSLALVDEGATVSVWTNTGSGFAQLLSTADSTFSSGRVAVEAAGNNARLTNLKAAPLQVGVAGMDAALNALPVKDAFSTMEDPLSGGGAWVALPWATSKTNHYAGRLQYGWGPGDPFPEVNGASWQKQTAWDTGSGVAASARLFSEPGVAERYFSLWLDTPAGSQRTGYELRFKETSASVYEVSLLKWQAGVKTVLASKLAYSLPLNSTFALVDKGAAVSVWIANASTFTQLLSANDSAFGGGFAGIEGSGSSLRLKAFKAGPLDPF